jgi:hypothetical protein
MYEYVKIACFLYTNDELLDKLVEHSYCKGISDLLLKLINIDDSNFDEVITSFPNNPLSISETEVKEKKIIMVNKLIEKLSPETTEEEHINVSSILSDLVQNIPYLFEDEAILEKLIGFLSSPVSPNIIFRMNLV